MRTKERLAQALHAAGLFQLEKRARAGAFDDFESPSATPIVDLVVALRAAGREDLAQQAIEGRWDATKAEADEWAESLEGKQALRELGGGVVPPSPGGDT